MPSDSATIVRTKCDLGRMWRWRVQGSPKASLRTTTSMIPRRTSPVLIPQVDDRAQAESNALSSYTPTFPILGSSLYAQMYSPTYGTSPSGFSFSTAMQMEQQVRRSMTHDTPLSSVCNRLSIPHIARPQQSQPGNIAFSNQAFSDTSRNHRSLAHDLFENNALVDADGVWPSLLSDDTVKRSAQNTSPLDLPKRMPSPVGERILFHPAEQ